MSLHALIVPSYTQMLRGLSSQLEKASLWADAAGVSEAQLLAARIAPDMNPLSDQIRFVCIQAREAVKRLTDQQIPDVEDEGVSLSSLRSAVAVTIELLTKVSESDFDGAENRDIELSLPNGMTFDMKGFEYVRDWALPQFYFHAVTAYNIMRKLGVELGKADYVSHMFSYIRPGSTVEAE